MPNAITELTGETRWPPVLGTFCRAEHMAPAELGRRSRALGNDSYAEMNLAWYFSSVLCGPPLYGSLGNPSPYPSPPFRGRGVG